MKKKQPKTITRLLRDFSLTYSKKFSLTDLKRGNFYKNIAIFAFLSYLIIKILNMCSNSLPKIERCTVDTNRKQTNKLINK